jgi:hypothetical protein
MNEVQKVLSAPEILIMQYIHGTDAVVDVAKSKNEKINVSQEKQRLKGLYDQSLVKRDTSIDAIFGPLGAVPTELPAELLERYDIVDEDDILAVAKSVTKQDKADSRYEPQTQVQADRLETLVDPSELSMDDIMG